MSKPWPSVGPQRVPLNSTGIAQEGEGAAPVVKRIQHDLDGVVVEDPLTPAQIGT